ncbi:uncharacterized protein LAESUDRAFT_725881 [Laetiporus sulphureus 93-53]|uniref:Probable methionine--tRNA ligase, mitochondrial n=1 Tax=Laetiporus sulphureus 93-53 TaxID=1314785 RepID=A0A165E8B8_9APHY|nr:uncharacterized protein LAESUDRAFT_725881 [Laetiporus sulphureus 93-53]KZT06445.1 hypothetical protein LAESUDRAFT_725881 [Laetiporus sulphureus 93-53]
MPGTLLHLTGRISNVIKHRWSRLLSSDAAIKPYYITTPIFYPNSVPHIGHLHSIVIGDILARYARLLHPKRQAKLVTGTDEHGLKIQKAAQARGMEPLAFCDELSEHFRALVKKADVDATRFSRTSEKQHCDAVQHLWRQLEAKGFIYKGQHSGWYSVSDECFYPELQVSRKSSSDGAEEEVFVSTETGSLVEWTEEENYKFRLSAFQARLREHFAAHPRAIYPPQHHTDILQSLAEDTPLEDLSVSRPRSRLKWGVPVPGDDEHTIYVWIDALTIYLSSVGYPWTQQAGDGFSSGWPPNVQVIGKDILRFHAIYFPAMLAALDLPFPKQLLAHSHWTVNKHKMSKSVGNVADPIEAIDEFGIDIVRWYLARVGGHFKDDVDWSHEQLDKHSKEITALLGNLYSRITSPKIMERGQSDTRPPLLRLVRPETDTFLEKALQVLPAYRENMDELQIAAALEHVVSVLHETNALVTQTKPWDKNTHMELVSAVYHLTLDVLRMCGVLLQPFMPGKAGMLLDAMHVPEDQRTIEFADIRRPWAGYVEPTPVKLFPMPRAKAE